MGIGLTLFRVDRTQRNQPQEQQWRRDQTAPREARRDLARVATVVLVVASSGAVLDLGIPGDCGAEPRHEAKANLAEPIQAHRPLFPLPCPPIVSKTFHAFFARLSRSLELMTYDLLLIIC